LFLVRYKTRLAKPRENNHVPNIGRVVDDLLIRLVELVDRELLDNWLDLVCDRKVNGSFGLWRATTGISAEAGSVEVEVDVVDLDGAVHGGRHKNNGSYEMK
jgi:hypothetical protein